MVSSIRKGRRIDGKDRLRANAEKLLSRLPKGFPIIPDKCSAEIIHELQVHQCELEIQNEELKTAHQNLEEVRDKYLDIFDFAPVGYFILTNTALIAEANLTGAAMLGVVRKVLIHDRFRKYVALEDVEQWDRFFLAVLAHDKQRACEIRLKMQDASIISTRMVGIRLDRDGEPTQVRITISDITDRKKIEDALRESEEKFRLVVETAPDAIFIQTNKRFVYLNPSACKLFGASSADELVGGVVTDRFHPKFTNNVPERMRILNEKRINFPRNEEVIIKLDGTPVDVETSAVSIRYAQNDGALVFARDVSERKIAENIIQSTIEEKEILLREVHHRVKNNLAVIISLIAMQSDIVSDEKTQELLADLQSRVMTIALVHESLYNTGNIAQIHFEEYLNRLIRQIIHSLSRHLDLKVIMNIEPIPIGLDIAIPCGLIINELITNTVKYAFPRGIPSEKGDNIPCSITVNFRRYGDLLCLQVSDNGIGMKEGTEWSSIKTLGLQIVSMLATHQLRGTIDLDTKNGTKFMIRFREHARRE